MKRRWVVFLLFFGFFFCCFFFLLNPVLVGWEAHSPLFRYSADFLSRYQGEPHGALLCSNAFLVQFAYYPALGAALYALLFCVLAGVVNLFASRPESADRQPLWSGFAVASCLLPIFPYSFCVVLLIFLAIACGGLVWKACRRQSPIEIGIQVVVLWILLLYIKEYTLLAWAVYTVSDIIEKSSTPFRKAGAAIAYLFALFIGGLLGVAWARPYLFFEQTWRFSFFFSTGSSTFEEPFYNFIAPPLAVFPLWIGILLLGTCPLGWEARLHRKWIFPLCAGVLSVFCLVVSPLACRELRTFFVADHLMREYKWKEALAVLEKDYVRHSQESQLTHSSMLYSAQLKCCLLAQRKATSQLFTYSLRSFPFLFPENLNNRAESYVLPIYYGYVGGFSESLHMNYDWVTARHINPVVLNEIIRASMIFGDTLPASKFVYLMEESLFRGKAARKNFEGQNQPYNRMIERGKTLIPTKNYSVSAYDPDRSMAANFYYQENNLYACEYFFTMVLLNKFSDFFPQEVERIKKYYPKGIPRHIQEAILSTYDYSPTRLSYPSKIEGIDQETWTDYRDFILDERSYQSKNLNFDEFYKKWKHTYWFYDLYMVRKNG